MTGMSDLPAELVGQVILTRIPITSLRAVRSTCKLWDALTKEWVLGKAAAAREQFLGFITKDSKVCSVRFHLCRSKDKEDEELLDLSVKQVDLLNQVDISRVVHSDGLLLCVTKDNSRLVVWNPYLGQTKWIGLGTCFHEADFYAFGYDINRNHKILRFLNYDRVPNKRYEIYEFSSNSWRVLNVTNDWELAFYQEVGVLVKGNSYFIANLEIDDDEMMDENDDFLICFDFTTERFGPRLLLPFHSPSHFEDILALSCVREEKLAVLYSQDGLVIDSSCNIVQIWVTTTIEPNYVSWSQFLRVEMKPNPLTGIFFNNLHRASFFIDEEEKIAVVFSIGKYETNKGRYNTAFIIGEDGYFRSVSLGVAHKVKSHFFEFRYSKLIRCPPLGCSSFYRPSLVQVNQPPRKRKERGNQRRKRKERGD